jgi:hypothetical protein
MEMLIISEKVSIVPAKEYVREKARENISSLTSYPRLTSLFQSYHELLLASRHIIVDAGILWRGHLDPSMGGG